MIEINLLPEELQVKSKKGSALKPDYAIYFIGLIFGLFICAHIYLGIVSVFKSYRLNSLNKRWQSLEPQRKIWESLKKEQELLSADAKYIQQLAKSRIIWSEKLNKISLDLPSGVWLWDLSINQKDFVLKGSAVSLQKQEMGLINKFMDNLKSDSTFFKDFSGLELSSVQRRTIADYDVVDFVLLGKLK